MDKFLIGRHPSASLRSAVTRAFRGGMEKCRYSASGYSAAWAPAAGMNRSLSIRLPSMSMISTFQPPTSKRVAFDRNARQPIEREPGRGVEFAARARCRPSLSASSSIERASVDQPRAVGAVHDVLRSAGSCSSGNSPAMAAEHVGQRHHAEKIAVLVDHEGDVQRHLAEHFQHAQHRDVLGHVDRLAQVALELQSAAGERDRRPDPSSARRRAGARDRRRAPRRGANTDNRRSRARSTSGSSSRSIQ